MLCAFSFLPCVLQSRDSSVGIALGYGLDDRGSRVLFPARIGNFSLHRRVQTALGPTQPPIQWVQGGCFSGGYGGRGVKLTTHLHLVPRSKTPSWRGVRLKHRDNFTFTFTFTLLLVWVWNFFSHSEGTERVEDSWKHNTCNKAHLSVERSNLHDEEVII
jgi:hypothetical protein